MLLTLDQQSIMCLYWGPLLALLQMLERMRAEAAVAQQASEEQHSQDVEAIRVATEERIQVMVLCCTHAKHLSVITCMIEYQVDRRANYIKALQPSCKAMPDPMQMVEHCCAGYERQRRVRASLGCREEACC